jgi:hypothetical protein
MKSFFAPDTDYNPEGVLMMNRVILLSVLFTWASAQALAQEGPIVPCVGCDALIHAPFPETGAWYNPDQSGTGINLEMQGGKLLGFYYGYDAEGRPEWQLFSGWLVRSEQEGVQWELETQMEHFEGGNCIGCDYQPPEAPTDGPVVKLEFKQRNYLRFTIDDHPSQFYVPIIYGSVGHQYFSEQTPYVFPEYGGSGDGVFSLAQFVLISKPNTDPPEPWNWNSKIVQIGKGRKLEEGPNTGQLVYSIVFIDNSAMEPVPDGHITCTLDNTSGQPGCVVDTSGKNYQMPIGNLGDSRFFGEADDGSTIEGLRLFYD